MIGYWNRLLREVVIALSPTELKECYDNAVRHCCSVQGQKLDSVILPTHDIL